MIWQGQQLCVTRVPSAGDLSDKVIALRTGFTPTGKTEKDARLTLSLDAGGNCVTLYTVTVLFYVMCGLLYQRCRAKRGQVVSYPTSLKASIKTAYGAGLSFTLTGGVLHMRDREEFTVLPLVTRHANNLTVQWELLPDDTPQEDIEASLKGGGWQVVARVHNFRNYQ